MRKEGLKKDGGPKNGNVEDPDLDSSAGVSENNEAANLNGSGGGDSEVNEVDPFDGLDPTNNVDATKKKPKKGAKETVLPVNVSDLAATGDEDDDADADGDGDYEVEDIVDHKVERKKKFYLVRWKNYGSESDTWEPEDSLSCPEIIEKYNSSLPADQKPGKKSKKAAKEEKPAAKSTSTKPKRAAASKPAVTDDDADEAENDFEVEDIIDHKKERGKNVFLIRWKGYGAASDTWEPEATLSCPAIVNKYKKTNMTDEPVAKKSSKSPKKEKKEKKEKKDKKPKKEKSEQDYEVQLIVDEKKEKGETKFLVRWKGWSPDSDTWEPESSLNCPELIKKYRDNQKQKRPSTKRAASSSKVKYTEPDEFDIEEIAVSPKKKAKTTVSAADEDYEVEVIVDHKTEKNKKFYLVKWKGWAASHNTWEPESSLSCPAIVKKYLESSKSKKTTKKQVESEKKSPKKKEEKKAKKSAKKALKTKASKKAVAEVEADWEVEEITDVKYNDDGTKDFLIRWKGCDVSQDTWEPESNVDCPALINKFMNKVDDDDVVVPKKKTRKA